LRRLDARRSPENASCHRFDPVVAPPNASPFRSRFLDARLAVSFVSIRPVDADFGPRDPPFA
jgi:hypothetical protein